MLRWVAQERTRRDGSLLGFWPLAFDFYDHAGMCHHARPALPGTANDPEPAPTRGLTTVSGRSGYAFGGTGLLTCVSTAEVAFDYSTPFSASVWFCRTADVAPFNTNVPLVAKTGTYLNSSFTARGLDVSLVPQVRPASDTGYAVNVQFRLMADTLNGYGIAVSSEFVPDSSMGLGEWHHLLVTYDGQGGPLRMAVYIDGRPVPVSVTANTAIGSPASTDNNVWLGGANYAWGNPTVATGVVLGMARLYSRNLSPTEVADLYAREESAYTSKALVVQNMPPSQSATLFVAGWDRTGASSTLFISTNDIVLSRPPLPLVTSGEPVHEQTTLVLPNTWDVRSASSPLWAVGGPNANDAPLFVRGKDVAVLGLPLALKADALPSASLALHVVGGSLPNAVGQATLVVGGLMPRDTRQMLLFLLGSSTDRTVRNMNLWVGGEAPRAAGVAELYLHNDQKMASDSVPLFLKVDGQLEGGQAGEGRLVLFLKRPFEEAVALYMHGPGLPAASPLFPLFVESAFTLEQNVTLAIPKTVGVLTPKVTLYTHGW